MRNRTHLRKSLQEFCLLKHRLNQPRSCGMVIQRDIIGNLLKILERRLGPDQSSHRDIRFLASALLSTRPSWIAFSPLAIPSRSPILAVMAS